MSVLRVADDGGLYYTGAEPFRAKEPGACCFYCARQFHPEDGEHIVHWMGAGGPAMPAAELDLNVPRAFSLALGMARPANDIYLHAECAVELWLRLGRDLYEIERQDDLRFRLGPRRAKTGRQRPRATSATIYGKD